MLPKAWAPKVAGHDNTLCLKRILLDATRDLDQHVYMQKAIIHWL